MGALSLPSPATPREPAQPLARVPVLGQRVDPEASFLLSIPGPVSAADRSLGTAGPAQDCTVSSVDSVVEGYRSCALRPLLLFKGV